MGGGPSGACGACGACGASVVVGGDGGWGEVVGEEAGEVVPVRLVRENGE